MGVRRSDGNLMFLYAVYLAALSIGNLMDRGFISLIGYPLPASIVFYPITIVVLCTICELWASDDAYRLVFLGMSAKFIGIILLTLSGFVTTQRSVTYFTWADPGFNKLLTLFGASLKNIGDRWVIGTSLRMWAGSLLSYSIAQLMAVWTFEFAYNNHVKRTGSPWGKRWYRYTVSSLVGHGLEYFLFTALAFAPKWGKVLDAFPAHIILRLIAIAIGLIPYYVLTWRTRR